MAQASQTCMEAEIVEDTAIADRNTPSVDPREYKQETVTGR